MSAGAPPAIKERGHHQPRPCYRHRTTTPPARVRAPACAATAGASAAAGSGTRRTDQHGRGAHLQQRRIASSPSTDTTTATSRHRQLVPDRDCRQRTHAPSGAAVCIAQADGEQQPWPDEKRMPNPSRRRHGITAAIAPPGTRAWMRPPGHEHALASREIAAPASTTCSMRETSTRGRTVHIERSSRIHHREISSHARSTSVHVDAVRRRADLCMRCVSHRARSDLESGRSQPVQVPLNATRVSARFDRRLSIA